MPPKPLPTDIRSGPPKKLRALTNLSLRKSNKVGTKLYNEWYEWPAGTVFDPPEHMMVERAFERGIVERAGRASLGSPVEEVNDGGE